MENIDIQTREKIIGLISVIIPDAKIYLFGSRARKVNRQWSDIDLALDAGVALPRLELTEIQDILAATNMPYRIDLFDFYALSDQEQETITKEREVWKS